MKRKILSIALALALVLSLAGHSLAAQTPADRLGHAYAAGQNHFLAVTATGTLYSWGANHYGQLGDGGINARPSPVNLRDGVRAVFAYNRSSFAVLDNGDLYAWGRNTNGILGTGDAAHRLTPTYIFPDVSLVVPGATFTYAVQTDGSLWCWGIDHGYLAAGKTNPLEPFKVMDDVLDVATNGDQTLALQTDGSLWSWGQSRYGLLGAQTDGTSPVKVLENVKAFALGQTLAGAVLEDSTLYVWGLKTLAKDSVTLDAAPVRQLTGVTGVTAELYALNYLNTAGVAWTIETPPETKSGVTSMTRQPAVKLIENVVSMVSAQTQTSFLLKDGSLWSRGTNHFGQLGDGTVVDRAAPVKTMSLDVLSLPFVSGTSTMIEKTDGSLWVCGLNGQNVDDAGLGTHITYPLKVLTGMPLPPVDLKLGEASSWATVHIEAAYANNLLPASLIGSYTRNATRAEFCLQAVMLMESVTGKTLDELIAERGIDLSTNTFTDTSDKVIVAASKLGVAAGKSTTIFDPNGDITREQAAVMLANTVRSLGLMSAAPANSFSDRATISSWATSAVDYVSANGIMNGTAKGFEPKLTFSREMADVTFVQLYNALTAN